MTTHTDGRTLPWRFLDRAVRPYALAVSLATTVSIWSVSTDRAAGQRLTLLASNSGANDTVTDGLIYAVS